MTIPTARPTAALRLRIDDDELAGCVSCGLCLPHCPTWRVTGDEARSPRGRIAAMREVQLGGAPLDDSFVDAIATCVQCRGCEPACPSGVPFGHLVEGAQRTIAEERGLPVGRRLALRALGHQRLVLAGSTALAVLQRARLVPSRRLGLPRLPVRRPPLPTTGSDVWLFTGCVMDAWQREVHVAAASLVELTGRGVRPTGAAVGCCGALAQHAGAHDEAVRRAEHVVATLDGDAPVLVDSAGCGAALKDVGRLLGTPAAERLAARVLDVHEWLAEHLDELPPPRPDAARPTVAVQDPCHLRHVQRVHLAVRRVLAPYADVAELDDDGLCCGAGGAWSVEHPDLAGEIRARKLAAIERAGAPVVASANPGCALHLAAAGLVVRHPVELVAAAIGGRDGG